VLRFEGRQAHFKDPAGSAERAVTFPEPILRGVTSADGRFAALLGGSGAARVFEVASGQELEALRQVSGVKMAALSGAAGLAAFAGADGKVRVVSIAAGHPVERFEAAGGAQWIGFSPGGKWLLASTDGIAFTLLRTASGQPAARVVHDRPATVLLFTADERHLATASEGDGTARIRDLEAGRDVLRWHLKTNLMAVDLAFADGDRIFEFTGTEYDETRLWRAEPWRPEDLVEAACRTVNRNLSEAEWRRYFPPYESLRATCARPP
jgi:WD40 repeat protein